MIIGLFLKHIKAYKGIKYIPVGEKYNFASYVGENGVGKSSILEAYDSFFNHKPYSINKSALSDGIRTTGNEPFFTPIFLIEKSKVTKKKKEFEKISSFFWSIQTRDLSPGARGSMKEFFELREKLNTNVAYSNETHYLLVFGEQNISPSRKLYFSSFHYEEIFLLYFLEKSKSDLEGITVTKKKTILSNWKSELDELLEKSDWKRFLQDLKDLYSYVYLPVELDVESFTKIETTEMQKIFDKKLKDEIELALNSIDLSTNDGINKKLDNFLLEIEQVLNNEYSYKTGQSRNNTITKSDIVNKIIEAYFQKRILYKRDGKIENKVSELSAGEKRQSLIDLVYAFLKKDSVREKMIIIGIDEPENSLHTSLCYEHFEKLQEISNNNQIFITTHWYGFLPIVSKGYGHFLSTENDKITFSTYDLYDYKAKIQQEVEATSNEMPNDFILKSTNDLVQAIYYSLQDEESYNWLIVEGVSEKIYFEYFLQQEISGNKLRILPLGGQRKVSELYEYLELPIKSIPSTIEGKIWCLIDTDQTRHKDYIQTGYKNLKLRRLSNQNSNNETKLLTLKNADTSTTDIEQSLNPIIFKITIEELTEEGQYQIDNILNEAGNSDFIKNFENLRLVDYFKLNQGENKVIFAKKYIEVMKRKNNDIEYIPRWVTEIKTFFNEKKKNSDNLTI